MKKLINVVDNEVVKNTKLNRQKTKVNNLYKKIPDASTIIHINQYNTDKQILEKNVRDFDKKDTRYKRFSDNYFEYKN